MNVLQHRSRRSILVTGGAGYIGSHMCKMLKAAGHRVVVIDNLSTGHREALWADECVIGDLADRAMLARVFGSRRFDAVMHFSGSSQVGESVHAPGKYYGNNVANSVQLLNAAVDGGVKAFVFSSSAAIFGEPEYLPIDEEHPENPVNPYGMSKLMVERMLADYDRAYGLRHASLRYFNAAGADPEGTLGERHDPETHLIPRALQALTGRAPALVLHGQDYDTPDGTCIRDYVHVADLCQAHLLAVERLWEGADSACFNLGNGRGYSVGEVLATVRLVTGRSVPLVRAARRAGDPARLVADSRRARETLGWRPRHATLAEIVKHSWQWELGLRGIVDAAGGAGAPARPLVVLSRVSNGRN